MNDEERQRTMDFILQQQAQLAAGMQRFEEGMQKLEEADARASRRLDRLERYLRLVGRRFRKERNELDERMTALINAQIKSEDKASRAEERLTRIEELTGRNSEDIAALAKVVANMARGRNGDDGAA